MSSLVNELEEPTLWTNGDGRWIGAGRTDVAPIDSRGNRVGMFSQIDYPVLEIHPGRWGGHHPLCIRQRKHRGPGWKSEGFKVPLEAEGQQNPGRGKGPYFGHATEARRIRGLRCR